MDIVILIKKLNLPNKALEKIFLYTQDIRLAAAYDRNLVKHIYDPKIHNDDRYILDINLLEIFIEDNLIDIDIDDLFRHAYSNDYQEMMEYTWNLIHKDNDNYDHMFILGALKNYYIETLHTLLDIYMERNISLSFIEMMDLIYATEYADVEIFKKMHQLGADITRIPILHQAYVFKSYELVEYLELFVNDGNNELLNQENIEYISCINMLKNINLPDKTVEKIILYTNDINIICAFSNKLAKKYYNPKTHNKMILEKDNVYLLDILTDIDLANTNDNNFSLHVLEYDSINIYKYIFKLELDDYFDINGRYNNDFKLCIQYNSEKIFEFLFKFYMSNGEKSLTFIGRDTLIEAIPYDNVDLWKKLFKYGARISQPNILIEVIECDSYKLVEYLESLYILKDDEDSDCGDSDSDGGGGGGGGGGDDEDIGENIENLLRSKINNTNSIIRILYKLKLPYEILEKIIIDTNDIYLISIFNPNLIKYTYFPETYFISYHSYYLKNHTDKQYIKILTPDNLIKDIEDIIYIICDRNCINLMRFLLIIFNRIDVLDYYVEIINLSIINNYIEMFETLVNNYIKQRKNIKIYKHALQIATEYNSVELFKTIYKYDQKIKYRSVVKKAIDNKAYKLIDYLYSLPGNIEEE